MSRDRERIAKPDRADEQEPHVEREKGERHIRPSRTGDDEAAEAGDQKPEPGDLPPLAWRDPPKTTCEYNDQCESRRIENMLVVPANDEFAPDRDG